MMAADCNNGSPTQTHQSHSLHSLPLVQNFGKRSVRTFFDFSHTNAPENLDAKCIPLLFLTNLSRISKVKVVSFLLGSTVTFLIMASYVLMWDKKGPLVTAIPYDLRPVVIPTSTLTDEVSFEKSLIDTTFLETIVSSIQKYTSRKVPDEKDVIGTDSHVFSVFPHHFLPGIKSPCWYEELSNKLSAVSGIPIRDPYKRNRFRMFSSSFRNVCDHLSASFHEHLSHRDGKHFRLRCLPYFYIIGQPKCGTTDLFHRLLMHPDVRFNTIKEPHWWTRKRFGYIRFKEGFQGNYPVEDYLDLFDLAAHNIQEGVSRNSSGLTQDHSALQIITGEASASTMWDNQAWSFLHRNREETEPLFMVQDFIHAVQPAAKIIIMLRDPVERLYSDYLYFTMANKSAEDFHQRVTESVQLFQSCLSEWSLRSCTYNTSLFNVMPVRLSLGMYFVFVLDWLTVFHKEQILVLRLEDYAANLKVTMKEVFDFLGVGSLSRMVETELTKRPMSNTRRAKDRKLGPMLPTTWNFLSKFYQPFNEELARVLNNNAFLWSTS
ncbi:carbohydrate sulfotransferase 15-like [Melanotaenia boesemani]|uniref:carbohydrate sulfotransferase 15-like n=1 Tax=Melanotaenia boesemani TaxID=1250792 RepID=UPI001C05C6D8|nr:carbohydrate sulfotransferase 15-like [Melanotaenia boesemani]